MWCSRKGTAYDMASTRPTKRTLRAAPAVYRVRIWVGSRQKNELWLGLELKLVLGLKKGR